MIYNFRNLKKFLEFDNEGDFYYLQIIQRRKDNPDMEVGEKVIKNYYIENRAYLDKKEDEIIKLCDNFNARAYLRLNRRNYTDLTYRANKLLADYMYSHQYRATMSLWDKVCGRYNSEPNRLWIIDIDELITDQEKIDMGKMCFMINQMRPESIHGHIKSVIHSKSGYHIIAEPFNIACFWDTFEESDLDLEVEIKKDNPTNLYIP